MVNGKQETHDNWWLNHWIRNCEWLVLRIEQMLDGEDVEGIIRTALPAFKAEIARGDGIGNR